MAQYDRQPGHTALIFASWARTALDDPAAIAEEDLPEFHANRREVTPHELYAIDRIDDLFDALDPAIESRENLARALSEAGMILASIHETIASIALDGCEAGSEEEIAYRETDKELGVALDALDVAISTLTPEDPATRSDVELYGAGSE